MCFGTSTQEIPKLLQYIKIETQIFLIDLSTSRQKRIYVTFFIFYFKTKMEVFSNTVAINTPMDCRVR